MRYVGLYLEESRAGSGYRTFLVLKEGQKKATLLYIPTMTKVVIPLELLESAKDFPFSEAKIKAKVRESCTSRHRNFCTWSRGAARQILGPRIVSGIEAKFAAQYKAREDADKERRAVAAQ